MHGLKGDWKKLERDLKRFPNLLGDNIKLATEKNAISARDAVKKLIRHGLPEWPPLKPATIARKGSSRPLIDHGDLMNSVIARKILKNSFFIGVPRNARRKSTRNVELAGRGGVMRQSQSSLFNIARVHEFGAPNAGIPARPFIVPAFDARLLRKLMARWRNAVRMTARGRKYSELKGILN